MEWLFGPLWLLKLLNKNYFLLYTENVAILRNPTHFVFLWTSNSPQVWLIILSSPPLGRGHMSHCPLDLHDYDSLMQCGPLIYVRNRWFMLDRRLRSLIALSMPITSALPLPISSADAIFQCTVGHWSVGVISSPPLIIDDHCHATYVRTDTANSPPPIATYRFDL